MEQKKQLPRDVYRADGIYEFKVRKLFATYCEVIDESTGITTYLHGTGSLKLFKGQTVKILGHAVVKALVAQKLFDFVINLGRLLNEPTDLVLDGKAHVAQFLVVDVARNDYRLPARKDFNQGGGTCLHDNAIRKFYQFVH